MPTLTFDTLVFITYKPTPERFPVGFRMSVVVLQELIAGAKDNSEVKALMGAFRSYEKEDRLLVPTAEDWVIAGQVINSLQRGRKSRKTGLTPKMAINEKYRIINDVLIARTAKREGVSVVTDNLRDFEKIKKFCNVRLIRAADFFRK
jgi:predicted nucleic acid-binding protein